MREHGQPIFDNVFVKQDALSIAQQPRQCSLPVQEREFTKILAISLTIDRLISSAVAAMADSRAVQSYALRL
jgi:flagellar basal body P-ring protein FlgI